MTGSQFLTDEEQNLVRVIAAAFLAAVVVITAYVFQCGQPDAHVAAMVPAGLLGVPSVVFNVVVWRVRMHW